MRGFLDFSSWSGLLTTLFGLVLVSLVAVGIPFVWVAGRALSRVIRALKR